MIKKTFATLLVFLLILSSFNVFSQSESESEKSYSQMDREEQQKYLEEKLGIFGVNPDDVDVNGNSATIKSGNVVIQPKEGIKITVIGGDVDVSSYSGEIEMGQSGELRTIRTKSEREFTFRDGGKIKIVNGEISKLEDVQLEEGTIIAHTVPGELSMLNSVSGRLSYDFTTNILTSNSNIRINTPAIKDYIFEIPSGSTIKVEFFKDGYTVSGDDVFVRSNVREEKVHSADLMGRLINRDAHFSGEVTFHSTENRVLATTLHANTK